MSAEALYAESLYWMLSTLPQVSAALVAFIGFLTLQRLDQVSRRMEGFEDRAMTRVEQVHPKSGELKGMTSEQIRAMTGEDFMTLLRRALPGMGKDFEWLGFYCDRWEPLDSYVKDLQRYCRRFVLANLVIIFACTAAILLAPYIRSVYGFGNAMQWTITGLLILACFIIPLSAAAMIREALSGRRL